MKLINGVRVLFILNDLFSFLIIISIIEDANRAYSHLKQLYENYQQIKEENPQPIVQKNEVENKDDENKQKIVKDVVLIEMVE